jgi:hypothetical protein
MFREVGFTVARAAPQSGGIVTAFLASAGGRPQSR